MSSNLEPLNAVADEAKVVATFEQAGNFIEQISCSSAAALQNHLLRCNREAKRVFPGRPVRLPENPAKHIDYFLTLDGAETIIEHSRPDQVISVQAGISIASLQTLLAQNKQWFPVCLPDESISLMEYINSGSSGPLEQGFGEARDLVLGMQVVLGTGELVKCGGKVVKNVTGYDMPKLFAGSHGTLCIPFAAHLRLYALPEASSTLVFHCQNSGNAFQAARLLRRSGLPISCLEIVDAEIFRLISNDRKPAWFASFAREAIILCVQIHGTIAVVAELEQELSKIVGQVSDCSLEKLEPENEQQLWQFLSRPNLFLQAEWLELCGPTRIIEDLLSKIKSEHKSSFAKNSTLSWTARPGRNKALIVLANEVGHKPHTETSNTEQNSLAKLIIDLANNSTGISSQVTIAYSDLNYLWNVRDLPKDDQVLNELKHRLKFQYDPQGVLNPLVSL